MERDNFKSIYYIIKLGIEHFVSSSKCEISSLDNCHNFLYLNVIEFNRDGTMSLLFACHFILAECKLQHNDKNCELNYVSKRDR